MTLVFLNFIDYIKFAGWSRLSRPRSIEVSKLIGRLPRLYSPGIDLILLFVTYIVLFTFDATDRDTAGRHPELTADSLSAIRNMDKETWPP